MKKINKTVKACLNSLKVTLLIFVGISNTLFAQDFELLKLHTAYYPTQTVEDFAENGGFGFIEFGAQLTLPQALKNQKKTLLFHTLGYTNLRVNTEGTFNNTSIEGTRYYHDISYNLRLIQSLSLKWIWMLNVQPTLASDFGESISEDDLLFQANTMVINRKSEKVKYGFGLAYNTRFGRQLLIPMGMFRYTTSKMSLEVLLPNKISLLFNTTNERFYYGLEIGLNGGFFNNTGRVETINTVVDEVGYRRVNTGPAIAVRLKNAIKITLAGGVSTGRRLDFIAANEEVIDRTPERGPFLRLGISITPSKKERG